jgi:hypothetical protein
VNLQGVAQIRAKTRKGDLQKIAALYFFIRQFPEKSTFRAASLAHIFQNPRNKTPIDRGRRSLTIQASCRLTVDG